MPPIRREVVEGYSSDPRAVTYHWCYCTKCTKINHTGKWIRPRGRLEHMNLRLNSDVGKFSATPREGFVIVQSVLKSEAHEGDFEPEQQGTSDTSTGEGQVVTAFAGRPGEGVSAAPSRESEARDVEIVSGRNQSPMAEGEDVMSDFGDPAVANVASGGDELGADDGNLGGHDEFVWDAEVPSDVEMQEGEDHTDNEKGPLTNANAIEPQRLEARLHAQADSEDSSSDDDSDANSDKYAEEADELEVGNWKPVCRLEDDMPQGNLWGLDALKIGEEELADANHHRPESRASSNADFDDQNRYEYQAVVVA
ncbi:hypothetical protein P7C70_g9270, partial [Phenoliferia sp. Uapishka_3]